MPLGRGEAEGRATEVSPRTTSETKLSEWLAALDDFRNWLIREAA
jgi:hypothetical protein